MRSPASRAAATIAVHQVVGLADLEIRMEASGGFEEGMLDLHRPYFSVVDPPRAVPSAYSLGD